MVKMNLLDSREEWLKVRKLGGSDIAAVIGISHWKSNVDLWMEKTGRTAPMDLSQNSLVEYGTEAELHIRELFALDYPDLAVDYKPNNLWTNDKIDFATASLDGWLTDQRERFGVLEIKTASIQNSRASEQWKGKVPDYYQAQLLWNMIVTEADFGVLVAQLKYEMDDDMFKITRHYMIEMADHLDDAEYIIMEARKFWLCVEENRKPAAKLPEI